MQKSTENKLVLFTNMNKIEKAFSPKLLEIVLKMTMINSVLICNHDDNSDNP